MRKLAIGLLTVLACSLPARAITAREILNNAAMDIAALYSIPKGAVPRIVLVQHHSTNLGWLNLWLDRKGNVTAIGDIHIVVERGSGECPVETLAHELWHVRQALDNRRVKQPHHFLPGMQIDHARMREAFAAVRKREYDSEALYREAEAFYMESIIVSHPRVQSWIQRYRALR